MTVDELIGQLQKLQQRGHGGAQVFSCDEGSNQVADLGKPRLERADWESGRGTHDMKKGTHYIVLTAGD